MFINRMWRQSSCSQSKILFVLRGDKPPQGSTNAKIMVGELSDPPSGDVGSVDPG